MLLKNDEVYTVSASDKREILAFLPGLKDGGSVRLMYPKGRIRFNPKNKTPDKPNSTASPCTTQIRTKSGVERWRYAESAHHGENGVVTYAPSNFVLRDKMPLNEYDIELIFWLVKTCPYLEGGENQDKMRQPKYAFENLHKDADTQASSKAERARVQTLIYDNEIGLSEEKLKVIAKAYFIKDVDKSTINMIRIAIEKEIQSDKVNGVAKFLELSGSKEDLTIKANIQNAIDNNIIIYQAKSRGWSWVTEGDKRNITITKIPPTASNNPSEALFTYYNGNREFAEQLISELKAVGMLVGDEAEEDVEE